MDDLPERFWEQEGWLRRMDEMGINKDALVPLEAMIDNNTFWEAVDDLLIIGHGEKAKRWLAMLEDPDPDDLIFEYNRIIRRIAFSQGYLRGLAEK